MIPSFVTGRPTGEEKGKYLALDLGGTNLRVCEFELKGDGDFSVHQQKYVVAEELKTGDMRNLCDFIADCVDNFTSEYGSSHVSDHLQLGFTFSFAVNQTGINRGTLMHWTKGFNCSNAINKDVVVMLQDSFLRKNIHVHVAAVSTLFFLFILQLLSLFLVSFSKLLLFFPNSCVHCVRGSNGKMSKKKKISLGGEWGRFLFFIFLCAPVSNNQFGYI